MTLKFDLHFSKVISWQNENDSFFITSYHIMKSRIQKIIAEKLMVENNKPDHSIKRTSFHKVKTCLNIFPDSGRKIHGVYALNYNIFII